MGKISDHNLSDYIARFGITTFVETGSGSGTGIRHACLLPFKRILSCDIDKHQAVKLQNEIGAQDKRVSIYGCASEDFLRFVLPTVRGNAVFFLDAHYPGADIGKAAYDAEANLDLRLPLERELDIIAELRHGFRDAIIIDDLRIYEEGPFGAGNLRDIGLGHIAKLGTTFLDRW